MTRFTIIDERDGVLRAAVHERDAKGTRLVGLFAMVPDAAPDTLREIARIALACLPQAFRLRVVSTVREAENSHERAGVGPKRREYKSLYVTESGLYSPTPGVAANDSEAAE